MGLFDIFKDPDELVKDDTVLRIQLWSGRDNEDSYQVDMTKRKLMAECVSYKAKGIYIMCVWDTSWQQRYLNKLSHQMSELTGYLEYKEKNEKKLDLVFYDGSSGSFSYKNTDSELLDGELNALNPIKDSILDEHEIDYIYHITHYNNVKNIIKHDLRAHTNEYVEENIDNEGVNSLREKREPRNNKKIHEYVPFYFNPRNPMLYANKEIQEDIVILAFDRRLILRDRTLFTDGNAASNDTYFFDDIDDLGMLNWEAINAFSWNDYEDGKRTRMAEVLVYNKVKSGLIKKIYCYDQATFDYISDLEPECEIDIKRDLYF